MQPLLYRFSAIFSGRYIGLLVSVMSLLLVSFHMESKGQELTPGYPLVRNYTFQEMDASPSNWKIVQDNRGVIYVANDEGVLEYDGTTWRKIDIKGGNPAYAMAIGEDGIIYVANEGDVGKLSPDSTGTLHYISLLDPHRENLENFTYRVLQVLPDENQIYFVSDKARISYNTVTDQIEILTYPIKEFCFKGSIIDGAFYTSSALKGLVRIENDSLIQMPGGEKFKGKTIVRMVKYAENLCYAITQGSGIFSYNLVTGEVSRMKLDESLEKDITLNILYEVVQLPSGDIELNTLTGGSYILSPDLEVKHFYNYRTGIQDEIIVSCLIASEGSIWYSLTSGISHIFTDIPVWNLNENHLLNGNIWDISFSKNNILAATTAGLFTSDLTSAQPTFTEILSDEGQKFTQSASIAVIDEMKQKLLVSTIMGIHEVDIDNSVDLGYRYRGMKSHVYSGKILKSRYDTNMIYEGYNGGVRNFSLHEDSLVLQHTFAYTGFYTNLLEASQDIIWTNLETGLLLKFDFKKKERHEYLLSEFTGNDLAKFHDFYYRDNQLYVYTSEGIFQYSSEEDKFELSNPFRDINFLRNKLIMRCVSDSTGNLFINCYEVEEGVKKFYSGMVKNSGPYANTFIHFNELPPVVCEKIFLSGGGISWFAFAQDIYAVDMDLYLNEKEKRITGYSYPCLIRSISASDSITFYGGYDPEKIASLVIPFKQRDLKIKWSLPYFFQEEKTTYRYELTGRKRLRNNNWENNTEIQLVNLPPGNYSFKVEARNVKNEISQPAGFTFKILFPWYIKWYMLSLYTLLFVSLIILTFFLYNRKLISDKIKLEKIVARRTQEIKLQKEVIERSNRDIMDSIMYAEKIQRALMLPDDDLGKLGLDGFILYLPLNIVSGDFYWVGKNGSKIITVAADCTGHGVPGAFMSMLGVAFLNNIVNAQGVVSASEILDDLRAEVISTLKQKGTEGEQKDGMDLALHIIDYNSMKIEYAGANNPMLLVRNGEIIQFKPDRMPIGIHANYKQPFKNVVRDIEKGDVVYIFSDGFQDQFGGPKNKKFMIKRLRQLFLDIHQRSMSEQKEILENTFHDWMIASGSKQIDDVIIIGIRI